MNILTVTVCTCWSIVLLVFVYGWGYRSGSKQRAQIKSEGYQPTHNILTDPPNGGSGVPNKF